MLFIVIVVVIATLVIIDTMMKKNARKKEDIISRTMPSGLILPENSEEMLAYKKADLIKWDKEDLRFFINYVGHRCDDDMSKEERKRWNDLFFEASRALYDY